MKKSIRNPKGLSLPQIQNLQQTIREYNKLHDKQLKKDLDEDIISSDVLPDISTTFSKWLSDEYGLELDDLTDDEYKEYKDEYNRTMKMVRKTYYSESKSRDPRLDESKLIEAPMDVKDYAARLRARKAEKGQNPLEKINSQIDPDMSITDQLQVYFDELVPESGPAKTVAGELVRAIMRILYRDYNDGDLWYTGYGKETCGDSVIYLIEHIEDLQDLFDDMIYKEMEDAEYTDALEDVASRVMVYLNEHPELFTTPLDKDSRSGADLESYFELPTYEFEPDTSYDEDYYDVSWDDIDEYINDVVNADFRGATVNRWARDGWTIEGLDKEQLEYLEDVWEKWFNDFLSQYEREEEPEEDYEDEDATAEADWDDSTDSEFDESLNKDNQKRGKRMKIVAEDFQECNLNKMGTNEYEANTNRKKHIDMYRKFANLNEDEVITEDMIDDLALTKTATYCNREPDRIRAEILGQRYSEYEQ